MKKNAVTFVRAIGLIFLFLAVARSAGAVVRIVPRDDYKKIKHFRPFKHPSDWVNLANPEIDFLNGLRDTLAGQHIGGDFDLVYQKDPVDGQVHIFSCPSARACMKKTGYVGDDQVVSCVNEPSHWQCQEIFIAPEQKVCTHFRHAYRWLLFKNWLVQNIVGTVIEAPIPFFNEGIVFILNNLAGAANAGFVVKQIKDSNCDSASMDETLKFSGDTVKPTGTEFIMRNNIVLAQEEKKENMSFALASFWRKVGERTEEMTDDEKMALGGFYRNVVLDPATINESGYVPVVGIGPILNKGQRTEIEVAKDMENALKLWDEEEVARVNEGQ